MATLRDLENAIYEQTQAEEETARAIEEAAKEAKKNARNLQNAIEEQAWAVEEAAKEAKANAERVQEAIEDQVYEARKTAWDAGTAADKEHFRPFVEKRLGHPVRLNDLVSHRRLNTWAAKDELRAEQAAARQALEAAIGMSLLPADCETEWDAAAGLWGFDSGFQFYRERFSEGFSALTWDDVMKVRGTELFDGWLEEYYNKPRWKTPKDAAFAATLCRYLKKPLKDIEGEGFGLSGGKAVADLRKAHEKWRSFRGPRANQQKELIFETFMNMPGMREFFVYQNKYKDEFDEFGIKEDTEIVFHAGKNKWGVEYVELPLSLIAENGKPLKHYFWDATSYVTVIPVDWSRFPGPEAYRFDFSPWDAYFNGRGPLPGAKPAAPKPAPKAAPQPAAPPVCKNCGKPLAPGKKFCGNCGVKADGAVAAMPVCKNCGKPLAPGKKFCGDCGAKIE